MNDRLVVALDRYSIGVTSTLDGHRWWSSIGAPVAIHILPNDDCYATVIDETKLVTKAEAEALLIEHGLIDPDEDDPSVPVNPWQADARRRQRLPHAPSEPPSDPLVALDPRLPGARDD